MKIQIGISRALLVLCALGFLCVSFSPVSAEDNKLLPPLSVC
jgi:hypothetical protein